MIVLIKSESISLNTDVLTLELDEISDMLLTINVKKKTELRIHDSDTFVHICCFVWCAVLRCHLFCYVFLVCGC